MNRLTTLMVSAAVLVVGAVLPWSRSVEGRPVPVRHYDTVTLGALLNHLAVIGDSYTAGSDEGGRGANGWTARAWQELGQRGLRVQADVAAEGGAGYVVRGNRGSTFADLTARAVRPDDVLVVFFGSRNDREVDPAELARSAQGTFDLAHRIAPSARLLVIGPPWPTADVPPDILRVRDTVRNEAVGAGAEFADPIAAGWFVGQPGLIGGDGVHPTDAGHRYLADMITPLIADQLPGPS
ncbi:MAG TPA: GDSL lipase [Mycobacterium sp.]